MTNHNEVIQAVRTATVAAAKHTSSPEDVRALAELVSSYNEMKDWLTTDSDKGR